MELNDKRLKLTPKRIEAMESLGIHNAEELLTYYPFRYDILNTSGPSSWKEKDRVTFEGTVTGRVTSNYFKGRNIARFQVLSDDEVIAVTIFNRPWAKTLKDGETITVTGIVSGRNKVTAINYNTKSLEEQSRITPVYSVKAGIQQRTVRECIKKAFAALEDTIIDRVPIRYMRAYWLLNRKDALHRIHEPQNENDLKQAVRTLKYEEFLRYFASIELLKQDNRIYVYKPPRVFDRSRIDRIIASLPYTLTEGQQSALDDILSDMASSSVMYRLIQGDVGCGKTAVAAIAMAAAADAGYQAALLAPTEVLARQHASTINGMLRPFGIRTVVLYSGLSASEKQSVLAAMADGSADVIIGTHSLLQEQAQFRNLGLVVADEQQRFGVNQRKTLREKGSQADFLLMSATPIPRTLASALYGDMNVSTIETMPSGRKPVQTILIKENSFRSVLPDINELLQQGRQLYVITAAIEKHEETPARAAEDVYPILVKLFHPYKVALLHGRMSSQEKEAVMDQFARNEAQVLVSTTVVEVGMNVVNATGMIIYDADRFGLSQLHQLRGRVQRGSEQGYCWMLTKSKDPDTLERLQVLVDTDDGFRISMEDLRLRGPGDILGTRQSGLPDLVLGNLAEDTAIMNTARKDAAELMKDPDDPDVILFFDQLKDAVRFD
ncbi:MAG: ATP-dependent DNA helicase RecG [Solobacterium sp.]|nr:ATP-dependent DNA helicase RecG [Solobacterium sp.]